MAQSRRFFVAVAAGLLLVSGAATAHAQRDPQQRDPQQRDPQQRRQQNPASQDAEAVRVWLHTQFAANIREPRALQDAQARLDRLTPQQVLQLAELYRRQQAGNQLAAQQQLAQAQALQQRLAAELAWRQGRVPRPVGFVPVITTLPQGAHLNAGGLISPDGRYVRINANPFFSSIPEYHTFNFFNGQTRRYPLTRPGVDPALPYGSQRRPPRTDVRVRHDGLRTVVEPARPRR